MDARCAIKVTQGWISLGQYFPKPRDHLCGASLHERLVKLCFECLTDLGTRADRSEYLGGAWQVALNLCNICLLRDRIHILRRDIENLIKFSQGFGKTTKVAVR